MLTPLRIGTKECLVWALVVVTGIVFYQIGQQGLAIMFIIAGMGLYYYFYFDIGSKAFRQKENVSDEEFNDIIYEDDDDGIVDGENNEGDDAGVKQNDGND